MEKQGNESEVDVNKDFNFDSKLPNESEINVNRDFYYREKVENEQELNTPNLSQGRGTFSADLKPTPYEVDGQVAEL